MHALEVYLFLIKDGSEFWSQGRQKSLLPLNFQCYGITTEIKVFPTESQQIFIATCVFFFPLFLVFLYSPRIAEATLHLGF